MHRFIRCGGWLVMSLALCVPTMGADQDKKVDDPKKDATKAGSNTPDPKAKVKAKPKNADWSFDFAGKLTAVAENDDQGLTFTIQVHYQYPELNPDAQRQIAQHQQTLVNQQMQLARAKSVQDQKNILGQMVNTQRQLEQSLAQLYRPKNVDFDVKCKAADNMRVRRFEPPLPIDPDSGEFVKMTKDMLEEARGKEGYPGFKADSKTLTNGQMVNVYVWKDSKTPADFLEKSKQEKMKIEDVKAELKNFRYDVIMLYIAAEAPSAKDKR